MNDNPLSICDDNQQIFVEFQKNFVKFKIGDKTYLYKTYGEKTYITPPPGSQKKIHWVQGVPRSTKQVPLPPQRFYVRFYSRGWDDDEGEFKPRKSTKRKEIYHHFFEHAAKEYITYHPPKKGEKHDIYARVFVSGNMKLTRAYGILKAHIQEYGMGMFNIPDLTDGEKKQNPDKISKNLISPTNETMILHMTKQTFTYDSNKTGTAIMIHILEPEP